MCVFTIYIRFRFAVPDMDSCFALTLSHPFRVTYNRMKQRRVK